MLRQDLRQNTLLQKAVSNQIAIFITTSDKTIDQEDDPNRRRMKKSIPVIVSGVGSVEDIAATWPGVSDRPGSDSDLTRTL